MSSFTLRQTNDKMYHLYFDSPSLADYQKVGQAQKAKFVSENNANFAILSYEKQSTQTLYGILNDKIFQVKLPKRSKVLIIDDICFYVRHGVWYTMGMKQDNFEEIALGIPRKMYFDGCQAYQYQMQHLWWMYFLNEYRENSYELSHFINGKHIKLGRYKSVSNCSNYVVGLTDDGQIDVFTPNSTAPLKPEANISFEGFVGPKEIKGIVLPDVENGKWVFYPGYRFIGENIAFKIKEDIEGNPLELYRINGCKLELIKSTTNYHFEGKMYCPTYLIMDDMIYHYDNINHQLDLDNPKPTFKKRIKNFFHLK